MYYVYDDDINIYVLDVLYIRCTGYVDVLYIRDMFTSGNTLPEGWRS